MTASCDIVSTEYHDPNRQEHEDLKENKDEEELFSPVVMIADLIAAGDHEG